MPSSVSSDHTGRQAAAKDTEKGQLNGLGTVAFWGLLVALIWAPWPLGSNRLWASAALACIVWVAVAMAALDWLRNPYAVQRTPLAKGWWWPAAAFSGFVLLLAMQMIPGLAPNGGTVSIDTFQTRRYLLNTLVYAGAAILVLLTVNSPQRLVQLLLAVVLTGVMQAAAAVLLYASDSSYQLWFASFDQGGRAMGTFVNPDHLAGYMELTLSAGVGWLITQMEDKVQPRGHGWRQTAVTGLSFMMSPKMVLRTLLVLPVAALVMTHSRGGNGAFFLTLLVVGAVVAAKSKRLRKPALWLVASMAIVDLFIIGQWVGLDRVAERIRDTAKASIQAEEPAVGFGAAVNTEPREQSIAERLEVPRLSLQLVAQRPVLGHGGGTYATAFAPFKQAHLPLHWDHAHNDFVQVACDTGLVGLMLWLAIGLTSAWRALQLVNDSRSQVQRGVGIGALMALGCMALHSTVDFNLHIPANAMTFTVLLAAVWASSEQRKSK